MVDDTIYGGGCGMLMKAAPLYAAVEAVRREVPRRRIIFMGPAGKPFDQAKARELATYDQLILNWARKVSVATLEPMPLV